jgi:hypothetical protein
MTTRRLRLSIDSSSIKRELMCKLLTDFQTGQCFKTSQRYIGRGPPLLQKGDHVCVFLGGNTPFVIRKASSVLFGIGHTYSLVGECYVEGLMRKEALYMNSWRRVPIFLEQLQAASTSFHSHWAAFSSSTLCDVPPCVICNPPSRAIEGQITRS